MEKYPKSFADVTMEGDLIGCGYGCLLNQIKTRVEHVNRDNTLVRVRKTKRINENESTPSSESTASKCAKTDSYGCIIWHPVDLPEDETPESVEEKRKEMVKLFSQEGPRAAERGQVEEWMKTTYASQRYAINNNPPPSIDELKDQWPFLFIKLVNIYQQTDTRELTERLLLRQHNMHASRCSREHTLKINIL